MFQKAFCCEGWQLFDPATLSWRFDGAGHIERLKHLKPPSERGPAGRSEKA